MILNFHHTLIAYVDNKLQTYQVDPYYKKIQMGNPLYWLHVHSLFLVTVFLHDILKI